MRGAAGLGFVRTILEKRSGRIAAIRLDVFGFIGLVGRADWRGRERFVHRKDARIGNFPAERFRFALMLGVFLEKNGLAGIGGQLACGREQNVAGAVLNFDALAEELGILRHASSVGRG